jgi:serine/threonine-protein kinase
VKPPDIQDCLQQALGTAYTIERELGGGGMSRVFLASEAALGRSVVVKVLRPDLAEALSGERFKREVRLAARLQHPHIVPLLAAGSMENGVLFYTMPFVEGESLRERVAREGALPLTETVRILSEVAGALAYAHRCGIVHRDVKPENILLSDGGAVVADFGIAKAISVAHEGDGAGEPGRTSTLTATGMSLGTPGYMAPEQAVADVIDHRADLYALGVVGYEMLAGRPPFDGRTTQQLLAAHATETPEPVSRRRPTVPGGLGALIMRLLEKNPADRPQSAEEVRQRLAGALDERGAPDQPATLRSTAGRRAREILPWVLLATAAGLAGIAAGARLFRSRQPPEPGPPIVSALAPPPGHELRPDGGVALSADGRKLAFTAEDRTGGTAIWVRALDSVAPARIDGTEGGLGAFWSPDGSALGFFGGGRLSVIELRTGTRRTLCPAPRPGGGTWTRDGTIVYSPDFLSVPLFRVPAAGGSCSQLTRFRPGEVLVHRRPSALPDGRRVIFSSGRTGGTSILAVDVATGTTAEIVPAAGEPQFVGPDWVLFREPAIGPLYAQRLDPETLRLQGEPSPVLDRVVGVRTLMSYAAGGDNLVAFQMNSGPQWLVMVNRRSVVVDSFRVPTGAPPFFGAASAAMAHDGGRIAFAASGPMWLYDRSRNVATRAQTGIIAGQGILEPDWAPGDSLIAYRTLFAGTLMLRMHHVDTDVSDSLFASGMRNLRTPDWSPDGRQIAFQLSAGDSTPNDEIWIYSLARRAASRAWPATANLASPRWSPDGRWMAYVSDETGAPEVYLRPVAVSGVAMRVSTAGGEYPNWRADGRELYYRAPDGAIMGVTVTLSPRQVLSRPTAVLAAPPFSRTIRSFEVTPDGERFVAFGREDPLLFTLVTNWTSRVANR